MTPEDVLFKLGELQPDEIARLMKDSGVLALRACSTACAVTQYVYNETREQFISTALYTLRYGQTPVSVILPDSVVDFVARFDNGNYPDLDAEHPMNLEVA